MNPLKPYTAILKDIKEENIDVKTYRLHVHNGSQSKARPGQFNMLGFPGIGEAPISFSGLDGNGDIEHTIRAVGMATHFLERMQKGGEVLLRGPYGTGWPMESLRGKDVLLIAGGVGLAPIRPVINEIMKSRSDFGEVSLLYGSRNEKGLLFTDEYQQWQKSIQVHITVDELTGTTPWKYNVGLITVLLDNVRFNADNTVAFVCGPEIMMRFICRGLMFKGVPASRLFVSLERRMKCGIAQCGHCQHVGLFVCRDGPVFPYNRVAGLFDGLL